MPFKIYTDCFHTILVSAKTGLTLLFTKNALGPQSCHYCRTTKQFNGDTAEKCWNAVAVFQVSFYLLHDVRLRREVRTEHLHAIVSVLKQIGLCYSRYSFECLPGKNVFKQDFDITNTTSRYSFECCLMMLSLL